MIFISAELIYELLRRMRAGMLALQDNNSATMKIDEPETPWASPPKELYADEDGALPCLPGAPPQGRSVPYLARQAVAQAPARVAGEHVSPGGALHVPHPEARFSGPSLSKPVSATELSPPPPRPCRSSPAALPPPPPPLWPPTRRAALSGTTVTRMRAHPTATCRAPCAAVAPAAAAPSRSSQMRRRARRRARRRERVRMG